MCEYCEEQKTIIDTFPVELKILPLEKIKKGKIIDKYYTLSINGIAYTKIDYCPMCRKEAGRVNEEEELDIPIKSLTKQLELGICMECGKRKAKYLCDYITGKSFDLYGKGKIETSTCDKLLCEKCTNKLNGKDYCKEHIKQLKEELKYRKLGDD